MFARSAQLEPFEPNARASDGSVLCIQRPSVTTKTSTTSIMQGHSSYQTMNATGASVEWVFGDIVTISKYS